MSVAGSLSRVRLIGSWLAVTIVEAKKSSRRITLSTGQAYSEILLVNGSQMLYRVNKQIF